MCATFVIGLDVGTSAIKAGLYTFAGEQYGKAVRKSVVQHPHPGHSEQDMLGVRQTSFETIQACVQSSGVNPAEIAAVACTGQGDGLWAVDRDGEPVGPAILWNDTRAAPVIDRWLAEGVLREHYERGGTVLWPGSAGAIMTWLRDAAPKTYDNIDTILFCKDWITFSLTGHRGTDVTDGSVPFMDVRSRSFDRKQLELLGIDDMWTRLPEVCESTEIVGSVTSEAAAATGLAAGTPVVAGALDVTANAVGAAVTRAGQSLTILGTTLLNGIVMDVPNFDPRDIGATVCNAVPDTWLRVLGSQTGTPNIDWVMRNFGDALLAQGAAADSEDFGALERLAKSAPVGANGVIYHPFINGERAPFLNMNASSSFFGLREHTSLADMVRAVFEGTAMSAKHSFRALGDPVDGIVLTGGGARNELWCQILADATGTRVEIPPGDEFGTKGAAILAAQGIGATTGFQWQPEAPTFRDDLVRTYEPISANQQRYEELFGIYEDTIHALAPIWKRQGDAVRRFASDLDGR